MFKFLKIGVPAALLLVLSACGPINGTVDGKSTGKLPAACPVDANRQYTITIKTGEKPGDQSGICVDEATWAKYKVGDPYP